MEYILTQQEFNGLMPKSEHNKKVLEMQNQIDALHKAIYPQTWCKGNFEKFYGYCDECILSFTGTGTCPKEYKNYSK